LDLVIVSNADYRNRDLKTQSIDNTVGASSSESDRYEELLANPVMLKAATQRGNIDCGGLDFLLVRYGNFFQFILPVSWGHVSVCIEKEADSIAIGEKVKSFFKEDIIIA
jgi:hypothetical protein